VSRTSSAAAVPMEEEVTTLGLALVLPQLKQNLSFNVSKTRETWEDLTKDQGGTHTFHFFSFVHVVEEKTEFPLEPFG
jgi:hypothetical protein